MENIQLIDSPEEALTPRETRLENAARILRWGAIINGVLAGVALLLALLGGLRVIPNIFSIVHTVALGRMAGSDDAALATVILLLLLNLSLLLVVMIGGVARELWTLPGVWLLALANLAALIFLGFTPALVTIIAAVWGGVIISRDVRAFRVNPVMLKELRGRMRGMRAFIVLTIYLGLMSGFTTLLYLVYDPFNRIGGSAAAGAIGRVLFMGIVGIELLLIIFIAPAFTSGAITGERERQTYDLLKTTLLASPSFVIGKLESALSYILLLLLAAIPLQSIAFLFGGVSETELILAFIILAVTAVALGTVGIYFSAVAPRTLAASVRSYTVALVITFGVPLVLSLVLGAFTNAVYGYATPIGGSPVAEALLIYMGQILVSINPIATALISQELLVQRQEIGFWTATLASDGSTIPLVSPWISFTIIYLVVSAILVVLAVRRMRKVEG
jgi:ABC-2 type transport system permease protein